MNTPGLRVAELWRYPVKSLAGERLHEAVVTPNGIVGDRIVHVRDGRGRVVTSRTRPRLLALHGTLGPEGEPLIDGRPWTAPESAAAVREAAGAEATLAHYEGPERFDVLPLLVATDGAMAAAAAADRRRRHQHGEAPGALRDDDVGSGHAGPGPLRAPSHRRRLRRNDGAGLGRRQRRHDRGRRSGRAGLVTWGAPSGPPTPPALRAPAKPWRSASVQSHTGPERAPHTPALRAPAKPWRSASVQSHTGPRAGPPHPRAAGRASGPAKIASTRWLFIRARAGSSVNIPIPLMYRVGTRPASGKRQWRPGRKRMRIL